MKEPNIFVDHEGAEVDRLAYLAISNPTPENMNNMLDASMERANKLTKYIIEKNRENNDK